MEAGQPYKKRRRGQDAIEEALSGELNLIPYLDVMVNLIMFLLLTTASASSFGLLAFNVPTFSKGGGGKPPEEAEKPLELTVWVSKDGYQVVSNKGAPLDPIRRTNSKENEGYDLKSLQLLLERIGKAYPKTKTATLFIEPLISYEISVKTLEVMKEAEPGKCLIERRLPTKTELATPFDATAPPACEISDDGNYMKCRRKQDQVAIYKGCLFPEVVLSDRVR
jgi:biopolymer transport protein TolR